MHTSLPPARAEGFTLVELMIVVAIIGLLAAIAIPKFADMIRTSQEGVTKSNLGSLRSALSIYYADMAGLYPAELSALTINGKYLSAIPCANEPSYHPQANSEVDGSITAPTDAGGWLYDNITNDSNLGTVLVNCTDTDTKSSVWTSY